MKPSNTRQHSLISIGEGDSFTKYATAVLGSITLVGFLRQVSARRLPFSVARGKNISF